MANPNNHGRVKRCSSVNNNVFGTKCELKDLQPRSNSDITHHYCWVQTNVD